MALVFKGWQQVVVIEGQPMNHLRTGIRIPIELPVHIQWRAQSGSSRKASGKTENISGNGLFLSFPGKVGRNTRIKLTVEFPSDATPKPLQLHCLGRVVRWNKSGEQPGIGVIIDDYEIRPASTAARSSSGKKSKAANISMRKPRNNQG
jgi:hypothetical protein